MSVDEPHRVVELEIDAVDGAARAGRVRTPRGTFETPVFMPVGTRATVRALSSLDLEQLGAEIMLGNTYHLMLRPGADVIDDLGGLHHFMAWDGHVLTDSGGFQIYSLDPKVTDEGALFRSTYDGSSHHLTPEGAVELQRQLGADIQMVLDVCPALPATAEVVRSAVDRTAGWAQRARAAFLVGRETARTPAQGNQAQFGIVQGGVDVALRGESARRTVEIGFDGYGIGGLSVGESRDEMLPALDRGHRRAAHRPTSLPHGCRRPDRVRRGDRPGRRHVRLRAGHPARPPRHDPDLDGPPQPAQRGARPQRPSPSTTSAAARCAPGGRGPTCATCC